MELQLIRDTTTPDAILGRLLVDGNQECYTLENRDLCIPLGTYPIGIYFSPHAGHFVPLLENVLNRSAIEVHCGNTSLDSHGCILVGQIRTADSIQNSRLAFQPLFTKIKTAIDSGYTITITVS